MPQSGRPARRAVSRPVCAHEKNPALSMDRKLFGTSTIGAHPVRSAPTVAPHDPPRSADACRSAIGRAILWIWALTAHTGVPSASKAAAASSGVRATLPARTGTPAARKRSLAWYSCIFMRDGTLAVGCSRRRQVRSPSRKYRRNLGRGNPLQSRPPNRSRPVGVRRCWLARRRPPSHSRYGTPGFSSARHRLYPRHSRNR
jgi:hypothetical protein